MFIVGVLIIMWNEKMIYCSNFSRKPQVYSILGFNICLSHQDLQMEIFEGRGLRSSKCA